MPAVKALRPPVEAGGRADESAVGLQGDTALRLGVLQLVDGGEMPIHQHGIGEWPQVLCQLQFGRIDPLCQGN